VEAQVHWSIARGRTSCGVLILTQNDGCNQCDKNANIVDCIHIRLTPRSATSSWKLRVIASRGSEGAQPAQAGCVTERQADPVRCTTTSAGGCLHRMVRCLEIHFAMDVRPPLSPSNCHQTFKSAIPESWSSEDAISNVLERACRGSSPNMHCLESGLIKEMLQ